MRRTSGFTLIELSIVVSLIALIVPGTFLLYRNLEAAHLTVLARAQAAESARAVSEALRGDLWGGTLEPGNGVTIHSPSCGRLSYQLEGQTLWRRAPENCGGDQAVANGVSAFAYDGGLVTLSLRAVLDPTRQVEVPFLIALGAP